MGNITFLPKDAPRLGDYARSSDGYDGRVYRITHGPEESADWLKANKITESELKETWLSMLVYPGGAVTGPASRFTKLDSPIPNFADQRDAADYFSDCVRDDTVYMDTTKLEDPFKV
jgi:hypothetical protein